MAPYIFKKLGGDYYLCNIYFILHTHHINTENKADGYNIDYVRNLLNILLYISTV